MTREEAIQWCNEIKAGEGCACDRDSFREALAPGRLTRKQWYDAEFYAGMEFGILLALVHAFSITDEEMHQKPRFTMGHDRKHDGESKTEELLTASGTGE